MLRGVSMENSVGDFRNSTALYLSASVIVLQNAVIHGELSQRDVDSR